MWNRKDKKKIFFRSSSLLDSLHLTTTTGTSTDSTLGSEDYLDPNWVTDKWELDARTIRKAQLARSAKLSSAGSSKKNLRSLSCSKIREKANLDCLDHAADDTVAQPLTTTESSNTCDDDVIDRQFLTQSCGAIPISRGRRKSVPESAAVSAPPSTTTRSGSPPRPVNQLSSSATPPPRPSKRKLFTTIAKRNRTLRSGAERQKRESMRRDGNSSDAKLSRQGSIRHLAEIMELSSTSLEPSATTTSTTTTSSSSNKSLDTLPIIHRRERTGSEGLAITSGFLPPHRGRPSTAPAGGDSSALPMFSPISDAAHAGVLSEHPPSTWCANDSSTPERVVRRALFHSPQAQYRAQPTPTNSGGNVDVPPHPAHQQRRASTPALMAHRYSSDGTSPSAKRNSIRRQMKKALKNL